MFVHYLLEILGKRRAAHGAESTREKMAWVMSTNALLLEYNQRMQTNADLEIAQCYKLMESLCLVFFLIY